MRRFCFVCNIKLCLFIKSLSSSISGLPDLKNEGIYQWVDGTKVTIKYNWEKKRMTLMMMMMKIALKSESMENGMIIIA